MASWREHSRLWTKKAGRPLGQRPALFHESLAAASRRDEGRLRDKHWVVEGATPRHDCRSHFRQSVIPIAHYKLRMRGDELRGDPRLGQLTMPFGPVWHRCFPLRPATTPRAWKPAPSGPATRGRSA